MTAVETDLRRPPSAPSSSAPPWPALAGPVGLAVLAMLSVQVGDALSVPLIDDVGPAGAAWLRLTLGAAVVLLVVRPRRLPAPGRERLVVVLLGASSAGLSTAFFAALQHVPLGTVAAVSFLGPLGVALVRCRAGRMAWPLVALLGVLLLTSPGTGDVPLVGVLLALGAAICWAAYVVLTAEVGRGLPGLQGLALSMPVAALLTTPWGAAPAVDHLGPVLLLLAVGLAVLFPVVPSVLELAVLRRLETGQFATLLSLEPALAVAVGAVLLGQLPTTAQVLGTALVVAAGVGVTRSRTAPPHVPVRPTSRKATP